MKKIFSVLLLLAVVIAAFAGCGETQTPGSDPLESAKDYIRGLYIDKSESTPANYELVNSVSVDGTAFEVEWTVEVKTGNQDDVKVVKGEKSTTIEVNSKTETEVVYVLKATVKAADGKTMSTEFNRKIPAYKESGFEDYVKAEVNSSVVVGGVVTGIISKSQGSSNNCLYINDPTDGGYYVYGMSKDPIADLNIEVGMTVKVAGTKDNYNGTLEVKDASVEVTDTNKKAVTPVDFTEIYKNAASLKDDALVSKQAMLVTIKGVTVTAAGDNGYYKFKLGDKETYVRISSSVCPLTKDEQTKFIADHAAHLGYVANVTGVICVYSGAFYLTPVSIDAYEYVSLPELDDAGKVDFELGNITLTDKALNSVEIDLPTAGKSYTSVSIGWKSDNACAVVNNGKLVITLPDAQTEVTVTATVTSGSVSKDKEFKITVAAAPKEPEASYVLTTTLKDGDKVVIYNPGSGMALSQEDLSETQTTYRKGIEIAANNGAITTNNVNIIWTVKVVDGGYKFVSNMGTTLSCANDKLVLDDTVDNVWALKEAKADKAFVVESTTSKGTSGDSRAIEWYAKYTEFSVYFYKEADDGLYAMQFFALGDAPAASGNEYKLSTTVKEGDKVVVYNAGAGMALSQEDLSETQPAYRKGIEVAANNGVITTNNANIVWTVKAVEGGYQFVSSIGTTLSCANGKLVLDNTVDNVWVLKEAKADKSFVIESTTSKGTSGDSRAIEWYAKYTEFSVYFYKEADDGLYAMQFYVLG